MSEFLEILSEGALEELKQVQDIVKTLASDIKSINNFKPSSTPSGADKGSLALAEAYKKREEQMDKARVALQKLSDAEAKAEAQKKAQMAAMFTAQEKANKKIEEQSRAYTELLARQKAATLALRDLVVETGKESVATKKLQKELNALNAELLQAEQASKKYAMGASSLATPVLLYAEAQKKATQATKEANAERAKANAMISKQMTGQMVESVNAIGKPTESLKRMNDYYRELEKTSAAEAKSVMANQNLSRAYVQLTANREKAKQKLQDYIAEETRSTAEIRKAQKEFDVLNKKVAAADKAVGRFSDANRKINGLAQGIGNLMGAFGVSTGLYLFANIAKDIYQTTKQLQGLDQDLKMVSGTQKEFAENQAFIAATSEKWGLEIKSATEQYTKFYTASKGILSDTEIKDIFESLAKSGSLLGASAEKQEGTFVALEQMMSKGKVTAEELTKQLGNAMPGALRAMAMAYMELHPQITDIQKAEQALFADMRKGAIDSKTYVPLYVKNYEKLVGIEMVNKVNTLQASQNRLNNSWTEMIRSMNENETGGITMFFSFILNSTKTLLDDLVRINTSWDNLYDKAKGKGRLRGVESAKERFQQGGGTLSGANASLTIARKNLADINKELTQVQIQGEAAVKYVAENKFRLGEGAYTQSDVDELRARKERLLEQKEFESGIIVETNRLVVEMGKKATTTGGATETEEQRKKREAAERKAEEKRLKAIEDAAKTEYDLKMSNLEREKEILADELKNEKDSLEYKLTLNDIYGLKEVQIAQAVYKEKERLAEGNSKLIQIAFNEQQTAIENAYEKSLENQKKIKEDYLKSDKEKTEEWFKNNPPIGIFETGTSKEDREKAISDRKQQLKEQSKLFNEFAGDFANKSGFSQTFDNFFKEDKNGVSLFDTIADPNSAMEAEERTKATMLVISSAIQDTLSLIDQAEEQRHQNTLNRLEREKEVQLRFAGDSEAAKAKINAEFDKKKQALEKKEFQRKKKMALVNIAIDTAQAVVAAGKPLTWWMIPAIIAMGAVQAGMVLAQKPPEYWKGTDNAEAGFAWTQERGAELILDKNNRIKSFGSSGGAELTMMEKGDKVKTAEQTKKLMFDNGLNSILSDNGIKEAKIEIINQGLTIDQMDTVLSKHFANITTQHVSFDKNGIQQWNERNGNRTIRNVNRGSGIGFRV